METIIQMIVPGVLIPLLLSGMLWWMSCHYTTVLWGLPLTWLPSYLWIVGWPPFIPAQATDWLWPLLVASIIINFILQSRLILLIAAQTTLLALVLIAIAWPVMQYQFDMLLVLEIILFVATAFIIVSIAIKKQPAAPALSLAISSGGMGLVIALGGSLLIGQLAGAMASTLGAFALIEVIRRCQQPSVNFINIIPPLQLYLTLLVIARIFAELPLGPTLLLLCTPLIGLLPAKRFAPVLSIITVISAMSWLLLTADSSSYY